MTVAAPDAVCQYDQYDYKSEFWTGRDYEHQLEYKLVQQLCQRYVSGDALMDVGCGFGRLFPAYSSIAKQFYLVDYSQSMLDQAQRAIQSDLVTFRQASVYALPTDLPEMDAVIMMRVLHHTPSLACVFSQLNRVLRPGGVLILEIPNQKHWLNRLRFRLGRIQHNPYHSNSMELGQLFYL
ncbi:MAG: class I SAM-dependent methyltransferase, partial [Candidatus Marinamargulisbacteria bacterium]|nr:class I SAM-dependent methyltransferase [Candidatus Marinamargulisbacteria bacterium]